MFVNQIQYGIKRLFLISLFVLVVQLCNAQKLIVKSFTPKNNDLAASTNLRTDNNGDACALVKVQLAKSGAQFEPNVIGEVEYKTNEYWVYLPTISKHLKVKHPDFLTTDVNFADYDIDKLEPKTTYELVLAIPVYKVTWNECIVFINRLNTLLANQLNGKKFRLPTEAEWEYAARGGQKSKGKKYCGNNDLGKVAWYADNSGTHAHPVGQKMPNELGLYDMLGNVWEWCNDWMGDYVKTQQTNPKGPSHGTDRIFRGGSCNYKARFCRVSRRSGFGPESIPGFIGLRLAL